MPKNSAPTRAAILSAAVHTLKRGGVATFTLGGVARRAGVVKGLVLYHFKSRDRLLREAAGTVAAQRAAGFARAGAAGSGIRRVDACWDELVRQEADGTARAWFGLAAAGVLDRPDKTPTLAAAARQAILDGCAAALAAGVPLAELRDAYHVLSLALLQTAKR